MIQNYVIVGDIHLNSVCKSRTDDYQETILRKMTWICKVANKLEAPIISVGDLLNEKPNEHNTPVKAYLDFTKLINDKLNGLFYICNIGNHDVTTNVNNWMNEQIAWLGLTNKKFVVCPDLQFTHNGFESIYGVSFKNNIEHKTDILITHDDWWFEDVVISKGRKIAKIYDVQSAQHPKLWINGHIHHGHPPIKIGETICINPGAIMRTVRNGIDDERKVKVTIVQFKNGKLSKYINKGVPHSKRENVFAEKITENPSTTAWNGEFQEFIEKLKESKDKIESVKPEKMIYKMHKGGLVEKPIAQKAIRRLRNETMVS